jgi:DNA polymerase V
MDVKTLRKVFGPQRPRHAGLAGDGRNEQGTKLHDGGLTLGYPSAGQLIRTGPLMLQPIPIEHVPIEMPMLLVRTPAGFPSPAQDDMEEPINLGDWLVEHPAASYVMRVEGYSMAGAGINDGDLIVVSRAKKPRSGQIVVALVHGDRTLKRLRKREGRHWLVAEAVGYPETIVDEHVEIWGVVVGLARKYG